jgi:hypothetical protein
MIARFLNSLLIAALLAPLSAQAETIVQPSTFEKISTGKTLYFYRNGLFFGAEQFLEGRKSLWQFQEGTGECLNGTWFENDGKICFTYVQDPRIQCWYVLQKSSGYSVRGENSPPELDIDLGHIDDEPLNCTGPGFGV